MDLVFGWLMVYIHICTTFCCNWTVPPVKECSRRCVDCYRRLM